VWVTVLRGRDLLRKGLAELSWLLESIVQFSQSSGKSVRINIGVLENIATAAERFREFLT
jgi:hypothetical protein